MRHTHSLVPVLLILASCTQHVEESASGTFEATEITVSAENSGKILSFDISEGDKLSEGQVVGVIDTVQLYLQKLQLERQAVSLRRSRPDVSKQIAVLKSQIEQAEKEKARIESLLEDGAATRKNLDDVTSQLSILKAQLDATESSLGSSVASLDANSSAVELQAAQIEDLLRKCRISSPVSGTVLAKYLEAGEMAVAGRPLMKVADLDTVYLRAYFTSDQLADISLGQEVKVIADFGGNARYEYPGRISWIASESEFTPKTIQTKNSRANLVYAVKIAVKNDGRLKIGLAGNVVLESVLK